MIGVGDFKANECNGVSRRSFLKTAAAVPFAMGAGLPSLLEVQAAQERARAKSVILLWLWGGPSHIDTFDPKPDAPMDYRVRLARSRQRSPGSTSLRCCRASRSVMTSSP